MKKVLLILLSLFLCLSVFVSCDTETEESSAIPESKEESSEVVSESSNITSETVSEDSFDDLSEEPEPEIPTNVKYYEGKYEMIGIVHGFGPPSGWYNGLLSGKYPLHDPDDRDVPDDIYYYVGFDADLTEEDIKFLKSVGVIFTNEEGNVFIKGNEVFPIEDDMTEEERNSAIRKNFEVMFKDVDLSQYTDDELKRLYGKYRVSAIGYVNEPVHRAIQAADKTYYVELRRIETDMSRYLEWIDSYREYNEYKAQSENIFKSAD